MNEKRKMRFFSRKQQQPEPDNNNDDQPPAEGSETKGDLNKIAAENDLAASASQAAGTAWLAGHLNHLTREQEQKLVDFKALVEESSDKAELYAAVAQKGSVAS